jgi:hypothetical protein
MYNIHWQLFVFGSVSGAYDETYAYEVKQSKSNQLNCHQYGSAIFRQLSGPIQEFWQHFYTPAWAHTATLAALFRQLSGPIQECWQYFLGSCMGPYNILGSTPQSALWAHLRVLAEYFRLLHGPIQ